MRLHPGEPRRVAVVVAHHADPVGVGLRPNRLHLSLEEVGRRVVGGHADADQRPGGVAVPRRDGALAAVPGRARFAPPRLSRPRRPRASRSQAEINAHRLVDRLEGRDRPEPAAIAHQDGILLGVVVALDRRGKRKVQRGVKGREEVRPWHPVGDRRRLATRNADPELANSLAAMEAGAPNDERVAAAHRKPGRKGVLEPDVELRLVLLAVNRSLLAWQASPQSRRNLRKLSSSRHSRALAGRRLAARPRPDAKVRTEDVQQARNRTRGQPRRNQRWSRSSSTTSPATAAP